ncbi:hypothetical protein D3C71_1513770 [compost metagenome]
MVDPAQATAGGRRGIEAEVGVVQRLACAALLHQVQQAAVWRAHGRHFTFVGADQATERLATEGRGALQRGLRIPDPQRRGAQRRPVGLEEVVAE